MSRPRAFTDAQFIKALPNNKDEAITVKEFYPKVGCQHSAAQKWLTTNVERGLVKLGTAGYMGALTYYAVSNRPEMWLPSAIDSRGVRRNIITWVKDLVSRDVEQLNIAYSKPFILAMLNTYINACSDNVKFTEANQAERAKLMQKRTKLQEALNTMDSFLNDPFLSSNNMEVITAQDSIRALSGDIDLDEVINQYNALRQLT